MKIVIAALMLLSARASFAQDKAPQTARGYFNELKAANNFNHYWIRLSVSMMMTASHLLRSSVGVRMSFRK